MGQVGKQSTIGRAWVVPEGGYAVGRLDGSDSVGGEWLEPESNRRPWVLVLWKKIYGLMGWGCQALEKGSGDFFRCSKNGMGNGIKFWGEEH